MMSGCLPLQIHSAVKRRPTPPVTQEGLFLASKTGLILDSAPAYGQAAGNRKSLARNPVLYDIANRASSSTCSHRWSPSLYATSVSRVHYTNVRPTQLSMRRDTAYPSMTVGVNARTE